MSLKFKRLASLVAPTLERPEIFPQKSPEIEPPSRQEPEIDEPPRRHSPEITPEPSPDATPPHPGRSPEISPPERHIQPIREPIPTPVHPET